MFFSPVFIGSMFNMWIIWQDLTASYPHYGHENHKGINGNWTL